MVCQSEFVQKTRVRCGHRHYLYPRQVLACQEVALGVCTRFEHTLENRFCTNPCQNNKCNMQHIEYDDDVRMI